MSFIIDPTKNTVSENIIPSGTSAGSANLNMAAPVNIEQTINTGIGGSGRFLKLDDTKTSYTLLDEDETVEVASTTYETIFLPTAVGKGGKKYVILRGVEGNQTLAIRSQLNELIDGVVQELLLVANNQHVELLSNDFVWNST